MKKPLFCAFALTVTGSIAAFANPLENASQIPAAIETKPWRSDKWRLVPTRTPESLPGLALQKTDQGLSRYGGQLARKVAATGFFRAQKVGARWWMVDPDGHLFLNVAVNAVGPEPTPKTRAALKQKFGDEAGWAAQTVALLRENGFNGSGSWSNDAVLQRVAAPLPYTPRWNFTGTYRAQRRKYGVLPLPTVDSAKTVPLFDAEWEEFCDSHARQIAATKDSPFLVGHFSDNELPFSLRALENYLALSAEDPGHQAALKWLRDKHGVAATIGDISDDDRQNFVAMVGQRYFSTVSRAIKKYDPNHLYLGTRFHANVMNQPLFMRAAGRYLDVVSINYYGTWTPQPNRMREWTANSGKPFLITEFYAKGEDTGMPNTGGAGWVVRTQRDRGLFYEQFALGLLESRNCVGWHWFKYSDNDPENQSADASNRDSNKGIVTATFEPFTPLLASMKRINQRVYGLADYFDRQSAVAP